MYGAQAYIICTDTGADIPWRTAHQQQIEIAHLHYTMNDTAYIYDLGRETNLSAFYFALRNGAAVGTIPVQPEAFVAQWTPILAAGMDVLYLSISARLSKSFLAAKNAREQMQQQYPMRRIVLVDTAACSIAQGMLAFEVAYMRKEGATIDETAGWVVENRAYLHMALLPEERKPLRDAGYFTGGAVGELLGRRSVLYMDANDTLQEAGRYKTQAEALLGMAAYVKQAGYALEQQVVSIAHADAPQVAATLSEVLAQETGCLRTSILPMGPIAGCYAGPGAVGVAFFGEKRQ